MFRLIILILWFVDTITRFFSNARLHMLSRSNHSRRIHVLWLSSNYVVYIVVLNISRFLVFIRFSNDQITTSITSARAFRQALSSSSEARKIIRQIQLYNKERHQFQLSHRRRHFLNTKQISAAFNRWDNTILNKTMTQEHFDSLCMKSIISMLNWYISRLSRSYFDRRKQTVYDQKI